MKTTFLLILLTILLSFTKAENALSEEVAIIVNDQNPVNELSEDQIASFFMKKSRQWSNKESVRFFDQNDDSEVRKYFLHNIIKKSSREIELYWIGQKLYSGNSAPLQVSTDNMMASMVARFPGAIGYVSSSFTNAEGVKKIIVKKD